MPCASIRLRLPNDLHHPANRLGCTKLRIGWVSARGSPQGRFSFDGAASSAKHIPEIERRLRISWIAFHEEAIEPFGFGKITQLLGSKGGIE